MYRFERLHQIYKSGIIAILRGLTEREILDVIPRLAECGIPTIEITLDSPDALQAIESSVRLFGDRAWIGAGTVLDSVSARQAISVGAEYIICPTVNLDVIATANRYGKPSIPGAMTPSEALQALEAGADAVKIFPANCLGIPFIQALRGPLPQIPLIPTGGIDEHNAAAWIEGGVLALGVSSALASAALCRSGDWREIMRRAAAFRTAIDSIRKRVL